MPLAESRSDQLSDLGLHPEWNRTGDRGVMDTRVVFMTHYIPLYQVRVLQEIAASVREFHVLLSTPIEPNRDFQPDWSGLDVTVQKNIMMRQPWRHHAGFTDRLFVHFPTDTQQQLRRLQPDVVMSLELGARSFGAANYCRRNPDTKLVLCTYMSQYTEQGRGWMRNRLRRRLTRQADAITYNGPSCFRYLRDELLVPGPKLFPLPYAADDRTIERGPVERDESSLRGKLLCIGQLSERKGVLPLAKQLVEYCSANPSRQIQLTFVGDGPKRGELESIACPANLDLRLLGNRPAAELAELMCESSVVIAPTLADEWLLVVNEAMHAGVPIVGSVYAQAVASLVRDGVNGWQYDPLNPATLFDAMEWYFSTDDAELAQMRVQTRRSVAERTPTWAAAGAIDAIEASVAAPWREPDPELRASLVKEGACP